MEVGTVWQFKEVLDRLLDIVTQSIQQALCLERVTHSPQLVTNCCHLLAKVIAELAAQARGIDVSVITWTVSLFLFQDLRLCCATAVNYSNNGEQDLDMVYQ